MLFFVEPSNLKGEVTIPGSKSNTTRAVVIATLAKGESVIENPLPSADCLSTVQVYQGFGAEVLEMAEDRWVIRGVGGRLRVPEDVLNTGNSGTTTYIAIGTAALIDGYTVITGDHQIRRRPAGPLLKAVQDLGGWAISTRGDGSAPVVIRGVIQGGSTRLPGINSQWLTPLLINAPLAPRDTEIVVDDLQERPYIDMTMGWLTRRGIEFQHEGYERFVIKGGQEYRAFRERIPADWESACFVMVAAAITDSEVTLYGLDTRDHQGDKVIVEILRAAGAEVEVRGYGEGGIRVKGGRPLTGMEIDCRDIPDAPPILAVLGTQAEGETVLYNLGASTLKETNRPKSIAQELKKMGADIRYEGDRLIVRRSRLRGAVIDGHTDHRIVMATAVAGLVAEGVTVVTDAQYCRISFPNFYEVFRSLGARILRVPDPEDLQKTEEVGR
ncbi:MAG TPA: 3-phosphoshikimate 1-carboxyvinyltransferase [Deltaproteobacteria bacterium]|nr:3-phosphoshikimate 1-carboxyvinyltransferase [Deltaproteobacteria bacterium]